MCVDEVLLDWLCVYYDGGSLLVVVSDGVSMLVCVGLFVGCIVSGLDFGCYLGL